MPKVMSLPIMFLLGQAHYWDGPAIGQARSWDRLAIGTGPFLGQALCSANLVTAHALSFSGKSDSWV